MENVLEKTEGVKCLASHRNGGAKRARGMVAYWIQIPVWGLMGKVMEVPF